MIRWQKTAKLIRVIRSPDTRPGEGQKSVARRLGQDGPSGVATTDAAAGEMDWLWIIALIAVVAVVLFYFLGRRRSTRI